MEVRKLSIYFKQPQPCSAMLFRILSSSRLSDAALHHQKLVLLDDGNWVRTDRYRNRHAEDQQWSMDKQSFTYAVASAGPAEHVSSLFEHHL